MKIKSSEQLHRFYVEYMLWLEGGGEEYFPFSFSRGCGLCIAIYQAYRDKAYSRELLKELKQQLSEAGLNVGYPFGGPDTYYEECRNKTCHKNYQRIRWVAKRIEDGIA